MKIPIKINLFRRKIMKKITENIGNSFANLGFPLSQQPEIKNILICRPNDRLGNLLLTTPLLQEVIATFPNCKIDLFVRGNLAPILFQNYGNVDRIIRLPKKPFKNLFSYSRSWIKLRNRKYDLVVNATKGSSSGRLATRFADSKYKFFGDVPYQFLEQYNNHNHIAKYPIYGLRYFLTYLGFKSNEQEIKSLDLKLSSSEIIDGKKALDGIINNGKETICIFTYATGTKCYSEQWWSKLYDRLKKEYSDFNIIEVLPVENISKINFQAPAFYSRDLREIGALFANTKVFIGADSGMMHLANASKVPTVGLFAVTDPRIYQPYGTCSIGIDTNNTSEDDLIKAIDKILLG